KSRFLGNGDRAEQRLVRSSAYGELKPRMWCWAGPFCRQLAESGYAHAVWKTTFDGRSYEVRREERERDSHVDLARAAALACCNCFDVCVGIDSEFVEPATPPRNRSDEKRAVFGTDRADLVSRGGLGHQDFPTPGRW